MGDRCNNVYYNLEISGSILDLYHRFSTSIKSNFINIMVQIKKKQKIKILKKMMMKLREKKMMMKLPLNEKKLRFGRSFSSSSSSSSMMN